MISESKLFGVLVKLFSLNIILHLPITFYQRRQLCALTVTYLVMFKYLFARSICCLLVSLKQNP